MARKGIAPFLRLIVLSILITKGEQHGYAIYKDILSFTKEKWKPSIGTIYRILNTMSKEGLLEKQRLSVGRKKVITYRITSKGLEAFINESRCVLVKMSSTLANFALALEKLGEAGTPIDRVVLEKFKDLHEVLDRIIKRYNG